jgi:uncharacterized damage-inducible protein DinB
MSRNLGGYRAAMATDLNTPELETLCRYLDAYRRVVPWKLEGLDDEAARQAAVPSGTSLAGLLKHLAFVERYWFQRVIAGRDVPVPWPDGDEDTDDEWRVGPGEHLADVVALYEREVAESRRIQAELTDPEATVEVDGEPVSVRRILIHMVEEVARHAGHADILREQLDGATGQFPDRE